jgi:hypothetical protein
MTYSTLRISAVLFTVSLTGVLAGCVSAEEQRYQDQNTCAGMGARYGSASHTQCMLQQQQRRDDEMLKYTQQAYMHSEMARNAQEMRESRRNNR